MMKHTVQVTSKHKTFLYQLYVSTRYDEVAAWGWDEVSIHEFLKMQLMAQERSYEQYPNASHQIILCNEQLAGRIMFCRTNEEITLIDISILPEYRNQGIGSQMIERLQTEARQAAKAIRLTVLDGNPAKRLYERLGFTVIGHNVLYIHMKWNEEYQKTTARQK